MPIRRIAVRLAASCIFLARRRAIREGDVRFIVCTGTSGKTLARSAIAYALRRRGESVVSAPYGYTNELGIVLAALGIESVKLFSYRGLVRICTAQAKPGTYACIELGADWYPDIPWFVRHFAPTLVCITAVATDVWVRPLEQIWAEKSLLVRSASGGFVSFNSDNPSVGSIETLPLPSRTIRIRTAKTGQRSFLVRLKERESEFTSGLSDLAPYREAFGFAVACLYSVGVAEQIPPDFFEAYEPPAQRLTVRMLSSGSLLIADTYKAIPQCTDYVLSLAQQMPAQRRVAVVSELRPLWLQKRRQYERLALLLRGFDEAYFAGPGSLYVRLRATLPKLERLDESGYGALAEKLRGYPASTVVVIKGAAPYRFSRIVEGLS
jgi:UDP-N-acetylmuramyl pentapeptide synthase